MLGGFPPEWQATNSETKGGDKMTQSLENRVALVTGAGSGIGRACAQMFAREGAKVVVSDIVVEGGEETVDMIKGAGGDAIFVKTDVTKAAEVEAMVNKAIETYGRLDCAHNNAGVPSSMLATADVPEDQWDHIINVNLKGIWLCMKYEIPQMLKQGKGAIVNTASTLSLVGWIKRPAYTTSKHGVAGLTKAAALDYATDGIRINAVCPGTVRTPLVETVIARRPEAEAEILAMLPIGRLANADEIAEAVVWLCSDAASFVTGHLMCVDGGWVIK